MDVKAMTRLMLYGASRSGNCYKPAWILSLTGREFEWVEKDVGAGATLKPGFHNVRDWLARIESTPGFPDMEAACR
jgi:glutathione S-transferase